jgi:hypothetical protein
LFLANFQHLATKSKSSANHTKDLCERNASKSSYFKGFKKKNYHIYTMGFSKLPLNCGESIFLHFSFTYSQIWLILVIDDCQCGLRKKIGKNKKNKINCLSGLEPTITYYKVESKFYFFDEKNILL